MNKKLRYAINPNKVITPPTRGTSKSAGIDLYMPLFTEEFLEEFKVKNPNICTIRKDEYSYYLLDKAILLAPGERILVPSGVHVKLDENTVQILFNKSGVASKKGLDVLACVIDEDYQGEIHINLVNTTNNIVMIRECEKIVQAIEFDTYYSELDECTLEALYPHKTERADGGFGSTNKV